VAWQLPNWHETVVLYRACWSVGAVAAALHHRNGARELTGQLELLDPALVLGAPDLPIAQVSDGGRGPGRRRLRVDAPDGGGRR
jgi:acyl-CoA synthetase (AMP-forming)/AMP-acid ligase II